MPRRGSVCRVFILAVEKFLHTTGNASMTRERLIEIYGAELRQACDDLGDHFDLCRGDIDFTDDGAMICREAEIMPPGYDRS
jgi:hypothetical protein